MTPITAYIALGSNVGDRRATLDSALACLRAADGVTVTAVSSFVETEPVGPPQRPYLNAAAELRTTLDPGVLLDLLHAVESSHGRDRGGETRWGPRRLDLDLLLYGERVIDEPGLTVPHPRMHERRFVLGPLAQIAPHAVHPARGRTVQWLLAALSAPSEYPRSGAS
jgi:2-amino-4-hydroxy-6-hydroxymethyldihydropteridine diphosphokinase